jgi:uncharacterized protein (TIGR02001 family)
MTKQCLCLLLSNNYKKENGMKTMKKILLACAVSTAAMLPALASADVSATAGVVSDYTFNGISQTDNGPALQLSLDYSSDYFYAGTWASNVDLGEDEDTEIEWDFYAGKYFQLSQSVSIDTGIAYYTYHGQDNKDGNTASDDFAYAEAYAKTGYASGLGFTELNLWYAWDYFGGGEGHSIAMLAHSYDVAEGHTLRLSVDQSTYDDSDVYWYDDSSSYVHYRLSYQTSYEGFDFELAAEDTSIDEEGALENASDARIVAGISYTFGS